MVGSTRRPAVGERGQPADDRARAAGDHRDQHGDEHHRGDGRRDGAQPEQPRAAGDQGPARGGSSADAGEELSNRSSHPPTLALAENAFGPGGVYPGIEALEARDDALDDSPCLLGPAARPSAVAAPSSAYAGGPTSVLMVNPSAGAGRRRSTTATRMYQPSWWTRSATVQAGLGSGPPPASVAETAARTYRLTWLIHDVQHLADRPRSTSPADGRAVDARPWSTESGGGRRSPGPAAWHRVADPDGPDRRADQRRAAGRQPAPRPSPAPAPRPRRPRPPPRSTPVPSRIDRGRTARIAGPRRGRRCWARAGA